MDRDYNLCIKKRFSLDLGNSENNGGRVIGFIVLYENDVHCSYLSSEIRLSIRCVPYLLTFKTIFAFNGLGRGAKS